MSEQIKLGAFIQCGEGLTFVSQMLFAMLLCIQEEGEHVTLHFTDGKMRTLTKVQSDNFLKAVGLREPLVKPVAGLNLPGATRSR